MFNEYVEQMKKATTAEMRKKVVDDMCKMFSFGVQKAYSVLQENGWQSGREKRKDAGASGVSLDTLKKAAALLKNGLRKNGRKTMSAGIARSILIQNGVDVPIGESRLRELLAKHTLSVENAKVKTPHQAMRTEYPNQVHFADPSVALLYFAPSGKQHILRDDEVYKNKPFLEGKENLKLWRYVLSDHYSSSICVKYYAAKGETSVNMYDFLLYAWGQKQISSYGFHGLPELLVWDCGTANISGAVTKALTALRVKTIPHLPGNPRAKGQVEKSNHIVETNFECLLKLEPVHSVEEINEAVERWCAAYNANLLPELDTRLNRGGGKVGSRYELWQHIAADQLKELPDADVCRQIFTTGVQVRKVGGDLAITVVHPNVKQSMRYSLSHLPNILVGQSVNVQPVLVDIEPLVLVSYEYQGEVIAEEIKPIEYDAVGFDVSAPVFGKSYKSLPDTLRETNSKKLDAIIGTGSKEIPFSGVTNGEGFKTHSLINADNIFAKQKKGTQIEVDTVEVHEILISATEAAKRIKARSGSLPEGFTDYLRSKYVGGVPVSMVDDLVQEWAAGDNAALMA